MSTALLLLTLITLPTSPDVKLKAFDRPQRYAAYKAHTIMPESLRFLVKRDAKVLFSGLRKGLRVKPSAINDAMIMAETKKITAMINNHRPFKNVVYQMGYVSGLIAVYTNPSLDSDKRIQKGFQFYLDKKLDRCLFVFNGHLPVFDNKDLQVLEQRVRQELSTISQTRGNYRNLLENRYAKVNGNWKHMFGERSAVFGVSSIYFSNMARLTAHLWYYAWASAHGDLTRTPYRGIQKRPGVRKN